MPVVDCSTLLGGCGTSCSLEAESVFKALSCDGFVFLQNHGIPKDEVENAFEVAKQFFDLPLDTKRIYSKALSTCTEHEGCTYMELKSVHGVGSVDLKESLNLFYPENKWPKKVLNFHPTFLKFVKHCERIGLSLLRVLADGMCLNDSSFFENCHRVCEPPPVNSTSLALMHYPPVSEDMEECQLRCREHTDFMSLTLLFQDTAGGFQVENQSGEWQNVPPVADTILVVAGNLMQRWTADRIKAINHRVFIPEEDVQKQQSRWSMAYFLAPDNDQVVQCVDGSNKYEPISVKDHIVACVSKYF